MSRAQGLAAKGEEPRTVPPLPPEIAKLTYDQYRSIRFRPERSLWRGEPGRVEAQFFHLGFYYKEPVSVFIVPSVSAQKADPFGFSAELFSYDRVATPRAAPELGFAGLRLHYPINDEGYRDEIIVFQGASYFRSLGRGQVYGLSARGLAIDTGEPTLEEFPRFSELYLVRPAPDDRFAWVLALLESRRATGAYAIRVAPNDTTVLDVTARVFLREPVAALGLAPLTSMYLFGEERPARFGDFRPEVHDSDGLVMLGKDGEWLVRPLRNPPRTTLSSFRLDSPKGFGLVQRDRRFESYQDLEARYQDRPSAWVEPVGDWGKGTVRLLEIATNLETDDNIAAMFVPEVVPADGLTLQYRLHLGPGVPGRGPAGKAIATRFTKEKSGERFLVDFVLGDRRTSAKEMHLVATATHGRIVEQHVEPNPFAAGFRGSFLVVPDANAADVELRAFLREGTDVVTETWSYLWQPKQ